MKITSVKNFSCKKAPHKLLIQKTNQSLTQAKEKTSFVPLKDLSSVLNISFNGKAKGVTGLNETLSDVILHDMDPEIFRFYAQKYPESFFEAILMKNTHNQNTLVHQAFDNSLNTFLQNGKEKSVVKNKYFKIMLDEAPGAVKKSLTIKDCHGQNVVGFLMDKGFPKEDLDFLQEFAPEEYAKALKDVDSKILNRWRISY